MEDQQTPESPSAIRVVLVDDHRMMRDGLRLRLSQEPDIRVVGEAVNGRQALEAVKQLRPDLLVLDMGLPDADGTDLTRQILELCPSTRVLILSAQGDAELLEQALRAGVSGYVLKANGADQLIEAIRAIASGKMYVCPELSSTMLFRLKRLLDNKDHPQPGALSERETEVLRLLAQGRNTKEIAAHLDLSAKTIETHRLRIMEKLELYSIAELTKYAIRKGLTSV